MTPAERLILENQKTILRALRSLLCHSNSVVHHVEDAMTRTREWLHADAITKNTDPH